MIIFSVKKKYVFIICCVFILFCVILLVPLKSISANSDSETATSEKDEEWIRWVDFSIPYKALCDTLEEDISAHKNGKNQSWIQSLAYLACKYGGNWKQYKNQDLKALIKSLNEGESIETLTKDMKHYSYFFEAYSAVLDGFVGEYEIETYDADGKTKTMVKKYGLKAFSPIARGYSFSHYDDFGSARSYGFRRKHLGHDLMGSVGTPIIAVESGIVECVGWNQYGGWRIGIRSFDSKRYYYYAHLRKGHPYNDMYEGKVVKAGDVIGYLGMTGYSTKENVNNINTPHLHFGIQLIFNEQQKDSNNEIWIDLYALTELLQKNKSAVQKDPQTKEYQRSFAFDEPILHSFAN